MDRVTVFAIALLAVGLASLVLILSFLTTYWPAL